MTAAITETYTPSQELRNIWKKMADEAAGRVVHETVWRHRNGYDFGEPKTFRPVNPEEGKAARYFKMDGNNQDIFLRVEPKDNMRTISYQFSGKPDETIHTSFVPVTRGPVMVIQSPRQDIFIWWGEEAQASANRNIKPESYLLPESLPPPISEPTPSAPTLRQRVRNWLTRAL